MGVWSGATDNWDTGIDFLIGTTGSGFAGVYHENGQSGWLGPTGFYRFDLRSLPERNESKTWDSVYVWAALSYLNQTMSFSMLAQPGACAERSTSVLAPPLDRRYLLELLAVPEGVPEAPPVGTVWELPLQGTFSLEMPTYRTANGLEGYRFAFTMTAAIPGPGDFDNNGRVDLLDHTVFADCLTGPDTQPTPTSVTAEECLETFDFDADTDVDSEDFAQFQRLRSGD